MWIVFFKQFNGLPAIPRVYQLIILFQYGFKKHVITRIIFSNQYLKFIFLDYLLNDFLFLYFLTMQFYSHIRNRKPKSCSLSYFRFHPDFTTHPFHDSFTDRQTKPCSLCKIVQLHESFKHGIFFIRVNTASRVGHIKIKRVFLQKMITETNRSFFREFYRIIEQIGNHLC